VPPARDWSERARLAGAHYREGRRLASTNRALQAYRELRTAVRLLTGATDPAHVELLVRALISLAHSHAEVRTFADGVRHLTAAETLLPGVAEPVRLDLLGHLRAQRALMLYRVGRLTESLAEYSASVDAMGRAAEHGQANEVALGRILMNQATAYLAVGDPVRAERNLRRCAEIAESGAVDPDHAGAMAALAAKAHHTLGSLAWKYGDIPRALRYQEEANERFRQLSPTMLAKLRLDQAEILLTAGLSEEAARHLDEALPELRRQRDFQNLAEAETFRAAAAVIDGEHDQARKFAAAARRRFLGRGNQTWAAIAALTGLRAAAGAALTHNPVPLGPPPTPPPPAAHATGAPNAPTRTRTSAPTVPAATPATSASAPPAGAPSATGATGVPAALPRRALELAGDLDRLRLPDESSVARLLAVRLHLRRGAVAEADRQLALVPRPRPYTPVDHHMLRRLCRAELAVARGDQRRALRQAAAALTELSRVRDRMGGLELLSGTAVHGRELGELAVRLVLDSPRAAGRRLFGWLERTRAQVYRYEPLPPMDNPLLGQRVGEYRALTRQLQTAQLTGEAGSAARLRARQAELEREVMRLGWRDGPWGKPRPTATFDEVAAALGDRVLVSYVVSGPELAAVVVADGRARLVRLGPVTGVLAAVRELHADLDALAPDSLPDPLVVAVTESARRRAAGLAATLLAPWQKLLGDRELVVVPTGELYAVAWHVLPALRGRPVSVAPSATSWLAALRGSGAVRAGRPTTRTPGCWPVRTPRSPRCSARWTAPGWRTWPRTAPTNRRTRCSPRWNWPTGRCSRTRRCGCGNRRSRWCWPRASWRCPGSGRATRPSASPARCSRPGCAR
jgi:tetratricopeptide (TPR) repeat protein